MKPVHVNIESDLLEGWSVHFYSPTLVPHTPMYSDEVEVNQAWSPGAGKHKFTSNVFHKGQRIVLHGHDCGAGIPDLAPPAVGHTNAWLPFIRLKSSRKVMFGASTVLMNGTPTGCAEDGDFPMLTCGDIVSLPTVFPTTNTANTVLVGATAADKKRGWEDIYDAISVDAALFVAGLVCPPAGAADFILGLLGFDGLKSVASAARGLERSIERSILSGGKEPISIKVESGSGAGGQGYEVKWTPATGDVEVVVETVGGPLRDQRSWKGNPKDLFGS
jgi:hypothetical protein